MVEFSENYVVNNSEGFLIANAIREGRRRRCLNMQKALNHLVARRRRVLNACFVVSVFHHNETTSLLSCSCRRLTRNTGWWENAGNNYYYSSEPRFKTTFWISLSTFRYIKLHWPISCWRNSDRGSSVPRTEASVLFISIRPQKLFIYRCTSNEFILCGTRFLFFPLHFFRIQSSAHGNYLQTSGIMGKKLLI